MGQLLDFARRHVDAEDVRAVVGEVAALIVELLCPQVIEVSVVDPLAIKRDEGVGHCAVACGHQDFFATVGVEQHEIGARFGAARMNYFRPDDVLIVAAAGLANVNDVVVERVRRDSCSMVTVHDNGRRLFGDKCGCATRSIINFGKGDAQRATKEGHQQDSNKGEQRQLPSILMHFQLLLV